MVATKTLHGLALDKNPTCYKNNTILVQVIEKFYLAGYMCISLVLVF